MKQYVIAISNREEDMVPFSASRLLASVAALQGLPKTVTRRLGTPNRVACRNHVGFWSHHDRESRLSYWLLPLGRSPATLAGYAVPMSVLRAESEVEDVFLRYAPASGAFTACGIVLDVVRHPHWAGRQLRIECAIVQPCVTPRHDLFVDSAALFREYDDRYIRSVDLEVRLVESNPTLAVDFTVRQGLLRRAV